MNRIPFTKKRVKEIHQPLQLVRSDLCGPMNVDSVGGSKYSLHLLMITPDMSRRISSRASLKCYQSLWNMWQWWKMKLICVHESLELTMVEYTSQYFKTFCAVKGIAHQLTNSYTRAKWRFRETESHTNWICKIHAHSCKDAIEVLARSCDHCSVSKQPESYKYTKGQNTIWKLVWEETKCVKFESFWKSLVCPHPRSLTKEAWSQEPQSNICQTPIGK